MPHSVKGEALYCFVTLRNGHMFSDSLVGELKVKGNLINYIQEYQKNNQLNI